MKSKLFDIEQFPKNKDIDVRLLNEYQVTIRNNQKIYEYKDAKTCSKCFKKQPIKEFYIADKPTGRRHNTCRDCKMRHKGVVEIGKTRFAIKIAKKGFRRCSVCKVIKPLTEYRKCASDYLGISNNCYECSRELHFQFQKKQREEVGDFYVKQYAIKNYGSYVNKSHDKYVAEIIAKREPKYHIDGHSFVTTRDFARYVFKAYGHPITMTEKRIMEGKTTEECKLSEYEMRRLKSGCNKGNIKITDTITNEVFIFFNTMDKELFKMFGTCTVRDGLKSGLPIGGKRSKYKNPCIIERI